MSIKGIGATPRFDPKSISNRILLLAALSHGNTHVRDLLISDDTKYMLDALRSLGVPITNTGDNDYRVQATGTQFPIKEVDLFLIQTKF